MKLAQIHDASGGLNAAIAANGGYRPITGHTLASLIEKAEQEDRELPDLAAELAITGGRTLPRYVTTCGGFFPSGKRKNGGNRVAIAPIATATTVRTI